MEFLRFIRENAAFLGAGVLLSFSSSWGQTFFISLFSAQIMEEISLSDAGWGGLYMVATTASAVVMVWAGALTDKIKVSRLIFIVVPGLALSCVAMAANSSVLGLVLIIFCLRFFGQGMLSQLSIVSMARWFSASRGKALAVSAMGISFGNAMLPILFVLLMGLLGWRATWLVAAVLCLASLPVLYALLQKERQPQSLAKDTQIAGMHGKHWTRVEMLRHPLFWLVCPMLLAVPAWGTVLFFQQVHFVEVKGWSLAGFTALFPFYIITVVIGLFGSGTLTDRYGSAFVMQFWPIPWALGFLFLALSESLFGAAIALVLCGLGQGIGSNVATAFFSEFYGTRFIGSIKAISAAVMVLGSALGPGASGALLTLGFGIETQYLAIVAFFCAAGVSLIIGVRWARSSLPLPA